MHKNIDIRKYKMALFILIIINCFTFLFNAISVGQNYIVGKIFKLSKKFDAVPLKTVGESFGQILAHQTFHHLIVVKQNKQKNKRQFTQKLHQK